MKKLLLTFLLLCSTASFAQDRYTLFFDHDKDELNEEWAGNLEKWVRANRQSTILRVEGYTDSTGTPGYNMKLAARRVANVSKSLVTFQATRMEQKVLGEAMSQTGNDADNRKVVIVYEPNVTTYTLSNPVPVEKQQPLKTTVEPVLEKEVSKAKKGDRLELHGMNFYGNSGTPLPESEPKLVELLKVMEARPTLRIEIQGHICCRTNDPDKVALARAKTVYNYLIENGIDKKRLSYKSFEGYYPLYPIPERSPEQEVANRRVEIQIIAL